VSEPLAKSKLPAAAKPTKAPKPEKQNDWKPLTPRAVRERLAASVHFSSKSVNTNARAAGVRISADARLDQPLIGLVTTALNRRVVDYLEGGGPGSMLSRCASVIEGTVDTDYKAVPPEQVALVREHAPVLDQHAEVGTGVIDARLRQVLFPSRSSLSGYLALTPLHSSVFSAHLRKTLQAEIDHRAEAEDASHRTRTKIKVGGANPQNAGRRSLITAMQRPLVFGAPREDQGLRTAYALFYKSTPVRGLVQRKTLAELAAWREGNRGASGRIESTATLRQEEHDLLTRIAHEAMTSLEEKRELLAPYVDQLGGWASEDLEDFDRALLDKEMRSRSWVRQFASRLLRIVESYKTARDARPMAGFGDVDDYLNMMAEALK
jgi:hypothetical protein